MGKITISKVLLIHSTSLKKKLTMKIVKLSNSWLLMRVKPDSDTVACFFIYFISWNVFQCNTQSFDLNKLSLSLVKDFYKKLANDWNRKYRI